MCKTPKKWKDLTEKDREYILSIYYIEASHKERCSIIQKKYGCTSSRTVRRWWQKLGATNTLDYLPEDLSNAKNNSISDDVEVLLITSAQSKTPINKMMLDSMLKYKEYIEKEYGKKTQIVVCPIRYRNPTSQTENKKVEEWWDSNITDYLFYDNIYFSDVIVSSMSRVQPTAKRPLMGFEAMAGDRHFILGHPKYQMNVVPRFRGEDIHIMSTTGSITTKNYSNSKSGEHGEIHHVYGFLVVEKDKDKCLVPRFVNVEIDGSFYDVNLKADKNGISKNTEIDALVLGDIHTRSIDKTLLDTTMDYFEGKRVKNLFLHDVFDGSTVNPHEDKDLYIKRRKIVNNQYSVIDEINESVDMVSYIVKGFNPEQTYVVESNHDIFLDRWINNFNWKNDLHNSDSYLLVSSIQQTKDLSEYGNVYGYCLTNRLKETTPFSDLVKYVPYGQNVKIHEVQCALHGDHGANGAKGSINTFGRLSFKSFTAHTHSHAVYNGSYVVGCSCKLEQYYNRKGLSSWSQGHGVIYPNGKRQQLIFTNDYKLTNLI